MTSWSFTSGLFTDPYFEDSVVIAFLGNLMFINHKFFTLFLVSKILIAKIIWLLLSFQSLGVVFRDIIVGDHSLWLISEALDAVFDTFADGPLVNTAADSVGLMPNLVELVPVLKSRVRSGLIGQSENDYLLQCFNCQMLTIFSS